MNKNEYLKNGTSLNYGKYRIIKHLASGGFGNTYEVVNTALPDRRLAMKEFYIKGDTYRKEDSLTVDVSNSSKKELFENCKAKFKTEAERICKIKTPHVVGIYDFFEENATAYYVMDFIDGKPLSTIIKEKGSPMSEPEALSVLYQMLDALDSVHKNNIWHMDIKPGNILMDGNGQCILIDFGASKQTSLDGSVTASTSLAYTPGYAPPEQMSGNKDCWGPWTDIYSLGATLYFLVSGNRPPTHDELLDQADSAFSFPANVSEHTRYLIKKMMVLSYRRRPEDVLHVRQLLEDKHPDGQSPVNYYQDSESETTVVGTPYTANNYQQQRAVQTPGNEPDKKKGSTMIVGILVGLALLLAVVISYMLFANGEKNAETEDLLRVQQLQDSINMIKEETATLKNSAATAKTEAKAQAEATAKAEAAAAEAAAAAAAARAAEESSRYSSASGTYQGRALGGRITINLNQNGNSLSGSEHWSNYKNRISLDGSIYDGNFDLSRYVSGEYKGNISGTISGKYMKCTLTSSKGEVNHFTLTR